MTEHMGNVYPLASYDSTPGKLQGSNMDEFMPLEESIDKLLMMEYEVSMKRYPYLMKY